LATHGVVNFYIAGVVTRDRRIGYFGVAYFLIPLPPQRILFCRSFRHIENMKLKIDEIDDEIDDEIENGQYGSCTFACKGTIDISMS
jgi:hypothetical protein